MDEYILEDNLKPAEVQVIKQMLDAIVKYPDAISNSFTLDRTAMREPIQGFRYRLSSKGSISTSFRNRQLLPDDCSLVLLSLGFVEPERGHNKSGSWFCFTEGALEWHRQYGGLNADEVRKQIGRYICNQGRRYMHSNMFEAAKVAAEIGVPEEQIRDQTELLMAKDLVETLHARDADFGILALTVPDGVLWAESRFPPIQSLNSQTISVSVNVEVRNIIQQVRAANVDAELLEKYEARLRRVEEELEKPHGQGRLQTVHDLVETANGSKDLLIPTVGFLATHADKIKTFGEAILSHIT